jgi:hypothetical protein
MTAAPYIDVTRCDVEKLLDTFCVSLQKIEVKRMGLGKKTGDWQSNSVVQSTTKSETPLDYMLRVMNDRFEDNRRRDDMAKAAAPYVHAKFLAVEFKPSSKVLIDTNKSSAEIRQEMLEWMASREACREPADFEGAIWWRPCSRHAACEKCGTSA